jgi:hypothetical protein
MTKSADYKQGYTKGYNTGRKETAELDRKYRDREMQLAVRTERAESDHGIGHCEGCKHWEKPRPEAQWGLCNAPQSPGSPWGCWAQGPYDNKWDRGLISTSPRFGCVLFSAKEA